MTDQFHLDNLYVALASSKRRGMVTTLAYRPATISQLAEEQALSLPAIHKHIVVLEKADLIERRKSGRVNYLALKASSLGQAQAWLNQFHATWGNDQQTLENYINELSRAER